LIYRSNVVPVGKDQVQHLEMTQDMAGKFNRLYGEIFPIPMPKVREETAKVPGIDGQKMSKSYGNTIEIFAEGNELKKKVMSVVTDSTPMGQPLNPDTCNVFALYSLFATPEEKQALAGQYRAGSIGYGGAKKMLLEKITAYFELARKKRKELAAQPHLAEEVLRKGAQRARAEAQQTMALVRPAVGIAPKSVG
jgi:tryptophanyl-tRNA synthetase